MKILSLNTHSWREDKPQEKLQILMDGIVEGDYDYICLQEVNQPIKGLATSDDSYILPVGEEVVPLKEGNFALEIITKLRERGVHYHWSWLANHISYDIYDEGVVILAKESFKAHGKRISQSSSYKNYLTRKVLAAEFDNLLVCSAHFSWWESPDGELLFKHECQEVSNFMAKFPHKRLIVAGDFNNEASIEGEGYQLIQLTNPRLLDAYMVAKERSGQYTVPGEIDGWSGEDQAKRIDYIFLTPEYTVESCSVIFDGKNLPVVSDHFGVEAVLNDNGWFTSSSVDR